MGYSGGNCGTDSLDQISYTGNIFTLASGAVTWESHKQRIFDLLTVEEYVALVSAIN